MSGEALNLHTSERALQTEFEFIAIFAGTPEAALDVREIVSPEDFYSPAMGKCYRFLMEKFDRDGKFIPKDMLNFVRSTEGEEALKVVKAAIVGVITYNADGVISRARQIRRFSIFRQAQETAEDIRYSAPETIEDILETALQRLSGLSMSNTAETLKPVQDTLADFVTEKTSGRTKGIIPTSYLKLDGILSMSRGDLVVIAARPGVGKSAFVGNLAVKFSLNGYKTALFSMEMSRDQIMNRILASVGQIPHDFLVKNSVFGKYAEDMGKAASMLYNRCMLEIDDKSCLTAGEIKRKSIKAKADVVIIDYLQLMKSARKYESKVNEVAEITRDLKIMAGDLNVPVILLSQLNRDVEKRAGQRPVLSDLRDSGSIEQDANSIIFLSKVDRNDPNSDILADVAKNRNGSTGQVIFRFDRNVQTFRETDREYKPCGAKERDY